LIKIAEILLESGAKVALFFLNKKKWAVFVLAVFFLSESEFSEF
jgi:hypothetical protein